MFQTVEFDSLRSSIEEALKLLRNTFQSDGKKGGWYHYLDSERPGPTASAVGLMSFCLFGAPFEHTGEILEYLKSTQVKSTDSKKNGGWPISMTGDQPIMEATGWVARSLGVSKAFLSADAPDTQSVYEWLLNNQNPDHGWGSFYGQPSRVYLTCMALRALVTLNPSCEALVLGQDWLLKNKTGNHPAWGATASSPPTVLHTGFVLMTLAELGDNTDLPTFRDAAEWIENKLNVEELWEPLSQVEDYDFIYNDGHKDVKYQNSLPHFALPVGVSALLHAHGFNHELVHKGLFTIVNSQDADGYWKNARNPARISMWAIWPFLQALYDAVSVPVVQPSQSITRVSNSLIVKSHKTRMPLLGLLFFDLVTTFGRKLMEYWSPLLLIVFIVGGMVLVSLNIIVLKEYFLSLFIPIILIFVQFALERREKRRNRK